MLVPQRQHGRELHALTGVGGAGHAGAARGQVRGADVDLSCGLDTDPATLFASGLGGEGAPGRAVDGPPGDHRVAEDTTTPGSTHRKGRSRTSTAAKRT